MVISKTDSIICRDQPLKLAYLHPG